MSTSNASSGATVEEHWRSLMPGLGSLVTLISEKQIRYEGALYSVNADEGKIMLANVRCFGTEDRECRRAVRSSDQVYEYVVFSANSVVKMEITKGCPYLFPPHAPIRRDPAVRLVATFGRRWGEDLSSSGETVDSAAPKDKGHGRRGARGAAHAATNGAGAAQAAGDKPQAAPGESKPARRLRFFPRRPGGRRSQPVGEALPTLTEVNEEGEAVATATATPGGGEFSSGIACSYPNVEVKRTGSPVLAGADLLPPLDLYLGEEVLEEVLEEEATDEEKTSTPTPTPSPAGDEATEAAGAGPASPPLSRRKVKSLSAAEASPLPEQMRMRRWATSEALAPERSVEAEEGGGSMEANGGEKTTHHERRRREVVRHRRHQSCPGADAADATSSRPVKTERNVSEKEAKSASVLRWSIDDVANGSSLFSIFDKLADEVEFGVHRVRKPRRWRRSLRRSLRNHSLPEEGLLTAC